MIIFVTDLGKTIEKQYIYEKNHDSLGGCVCSVRMLLSA